MDRWTHGHFVLQSTQQRKHANSIQLIASSFTKFKTNEDQQMSTSKLGSPNVKNDFLSFTLCVSKPPKKPSNCKSPPKEVEQVYRQVLVAEDKHRKKYKTNALSYKKDKYNKPRYGKYSVFRIDNEGSLLTIGTYPFNKNNSLYVELCPIGGKKSLKKAFKMLKCVLGAELANSIYEKAKITRMDIAIDLVDVFLNDFFFDLEGVYDCAPKYRYGRLYEVLLGSINSNNSLRIYDKALEQKERKRVQGYLEPLLRIEFVSKPGTSFAKLEKEVANPLLRFKCYNKRDVEGLQDADFYADCREKGIRQALSARKGPHQRRLKNALPSAEHTLIDTEKVWKKYVKTLQVFMPTG